MSDKLLGGVCALIAILSSGIMVAIGAISGNWENLWLIPFFGGILIAALVIITSAMKKSDNK